MAQRPIHINLAVSDPKNIQAENDAAVISGIIGASAASASGILAFGNRMEVSKVDNNSVRISDGVYANQGFCLQIPDSEILTILSGSLGKMRIDLIVSEFRKGAERDSHEIKIIQGELYDSSPVAPELIVEDLHGAGAVRQEEIGRVILTGTDITSVARTAPVLKGLTEIAGSIGNLSSLATSYKNDLVWAINELKDMIDSILANNSLLKLNLNFTNGGTVITANELGIENPLLYGWIMQPIYKPGAEILYGVVQPASDRLVIYLRTTNGALPGDGYYGVFLMRVDLS